MTISLIAAAITWAVNRTKDRREAEKARALRDEELKWRRTQFIFEQAKLFDTHPDISDAARLIADKIPNVSTRDVLDDKSHIDPEVRGRYRHNLDKLFNLLERLAFAVERRVLTVDELKSLEWYYDAVREKECLSDYCQTYFPAILRMADVLVPRNESEKSGSE